MSNTYQQIQSTLSYLQFTLQIQHSCYYQFRQVYTMNNPLLAPNSTTTPTSNSSFDNRCQKNNHIFDWLNIKQTLIVMRDIVVIPTKIVRNEHQINVTTHMTRQNGSIFLIPSNYLSVFNFNNKCSENTQYQIREFRDCFTVDLLVKFQKTDVSAEAQARIQANIEQAIQNYRKFLSILGYVQIGSSHSYKLKYLITKLKKQIITSVKLRRANSSQDPIPSAHGQESNVNKVSEIAIKNFYSSGNEDCHKARNFKRGGYFNIDKKQCRITLCDGREIDKTLALKKVRKVVHKQQNKQSQQQSKEKLEHQLRIISKLKHSKYLINYYNPPQDFFFGMQFIERSLKDVIYAKDVLKVKQILYLSKQLISGVQYIHKMGVIHRDLKPDNILVAKIQDSSIQLKIIDFGQSVIIDESQADKQKRRFGCTPPYSPIQCVIDCMDGINKKEIDFWSVSMIIYELSFRERPLYYNKAICQTVLQEQPEYFDYRPVLSHRPLQGIRKIEQLTYLLTEQNLRLAQDERLPLSTLYQCINSMQNFYDQVIKKFEAW